MANRRAPMEAGERDRLVTLQAVTQGKGASGAPVETVATLASVYASKADLSARERYLADQESAAADTRWEIDYRSDMDPELVDVPKSRRLVYQGRSHDIVTASQIGRREGVELVTLAKVDA